MNASDSNTKEPTVGSKLVAKFNGEVVGERRSERAYVWALVGFNDEAHGAAEVARYEATRALCLAEVEALRAEVAKLPEGDLDRLEARWEALRCDCSGFCDHSKARNRVSDSLFAHPARKIRYNLEHVARMEKNIAEERAKVRDGRAFVLRWSQSDKAAGQAKHEFSDRFPTAVLVPVERVETASRKSRKA